MKDIVIFGAGGHAREIAFLIEEINNEFREWNILGFVEKDKTNLDTMDRKYSIYCTEDELLELDHPIAAALGIGKPKIIRSIAKKFEDHPNVSFPNLIHPDTVWDRDRINMGRGNIICAGNIFTTDINIGSFNCFNRNSTYGHDIEIGDFCIFNPGLSISGSVKVESSCLIGTGATILQNVGIGKGAVVGAGAVVIKDVLSGSTVIGVPAKPYQGDS